MNDLGTPTLDTRLREALVALSRMLHGGEPREVLFERLALSAARLLEADRALIVCIRPGCRRLATMAALNLSADYQAVLSAYYEQSVGGLMALLGKPQFVPDIQADPRIAPQLKAAAAREGYRALLSLPIVQEDEAVGGLGLYWDYPHQVDDTALALAQLFADQAALAFSADPARAADRANTAEHVRRLEALSRTLSASLDEAVLRDRLRTDFLHAVAHELRNPLTTIRGYVEFIEDGLAGPVTPAQASAVAVIGQATLQLADLVDNLLDSARMAAGAFTMTPGPLDLAPLLADVVAAVQPAAAARSIRIEADWAPPLPPVKADADRVRQIGLNLLSNAIKFTPERGLVRVTARPDAELVRITVTDTGPGLGEDVRRNLFRRFYRAQDPATRATKGSGLGLLIAKQLVEAQGGTLSVESTPGAGSAFSFTLPR